MPDASEITTPRLVLSVLTAADLSAFVDGRREDVPFAWPAWWPDDVDRHHVELWLSRATTSGPTMWGARAVLQRSTTSMVGHAGFHLPPQPLADAVSDPTFEGDATPAAGGVVEVGYTIFPDERRRGYATEAVDALISWAFGTGEGSTVLASVAETNDASLGVLHRVGGFHAIGTCRDDDGTLEIVYRRDRDD